MSLVSIIIPAYNHRDALTTCLASLEAQSYQEIEIIVVDDGSTDGTEARFASRASTRPYLFIRRDQNNGAAAARNRGAEAATGDALLFVDADAVLRPDAVLKLMQALKASPEAAFVYSSFRFGLKAFRVGPFDPDALRRGPLIHTTALVRRSAFPGFDESLKKFQDWDLWLTVVERGGAGVWIPEQLFRVSVRKGGISSWLPSFMHQIPWPILGWTPREVARYRHWKSVVKKKHGSTAP